MSGTHPPVSSRIQIMKKLLLIGAMLLCSVAYGANAADTATSTRLMTIVSQVMGGRSPDSVTATPIPGIYEVAYGAQLFYVSEDGKYLFKGDIYDLQKRVSLTEEHRAGARLAALNALGESSMIIYPAKGKAKHTITVFTDIDCGYCRKLHQGMAEMNNLGITVRYLSFPRAGVNSDSYYKAVKVWCAKDRNKAMDLAKTDQPVAETKNCDAPILRHMALAQSFGVSYTPAIVLDDGRLIPGYLSPQQLASVLDEKK